MIERLWELDLKALYFINVHFADPLLDEFWKNITRLHKQPLILYGLLPIVFAYLLYIYRLHAFKVLLAMGVAVALSDTFCYRVIKSVVDRPRPFENQEVSGWLRKVGDAHGPSFPSNHAANCFAGATILAWYFRRRRIFFYGFAVLVAVSRPALGVHYPSDVLAGACLGILVGWLVISLLLNRFRFFRLPLRVSEQDIHSGDWRIRSRRISET